MREYMLEWLWWEYGRGIDDLKYFGWFEIFRGKEVIGGYYEVLFWLFVYWFFGVFIVVKLRFSIGGFKIVAFMLVLCIVCCFKFMV